MNVPFSVDKIPFLRNQAKHSNKIGSLWIRFRQHGKLVAELGNTTNLFIYSSSVQLSLSKFTAKRSLQTIDNMIVRMMLIVEKNAVIFVRLLSTGKT